MASEHEGERVGATGELAADLEAYMHRHMQTAQAAVAAAYTHRDEALRMERLQEAAEAVRVAKVLSRARKRLLSGR